MKNNLVMLRKINDIYEITIVDSLISSKLFLEAISNINKHRPVGVWFVQVITELDERIAFRVKCSHDEAVCIHSYIKNNL